jgi:catechol 2,3-dioxygenase-like lactoylglutathione lyase family enzyme
MLGTHDAIATVAVKDLEAARAFYQDTLGLVPIDREGDEVIVFRSGITKLNVYRSQYAGTNQATAVNWAVDDVRGAVAALREKGVRFEHYDMPGITRDGDVHLGGGVEVAWFKDPDGNILSIVNG